MIKRKVPTRERCRHGFTIYEHHSLVRAAPPRDVWHLDYKTCCPMDCADKQAR